MPMFVYRSKREGSVYVVPIVLVMLVPMTMFRAIAVTVEMRVTAQSTFQTRATRDLKACP